MPSFKSSTTSNKYHEGHTIKYGYDYMISTDIELYRLTSEVETVDYNTRNIMMTQLDTNFPSIFWAGYSNRLHSK